MSKVKALIVGGGGGGGTWGGGGGGAGGLQYNSDVSVSTQTYPVVVGAGGAASNNGSSSSFNSITANGGGAGGNFDNEGNSGASGGGGGGALSGGGKNGGSATQGNSGGKSSSSITSTLISAGGGGGSSVAGGNASAGTPGNGGNGTANSISGSSVTYAGGGGGGGNSGGAGGTGGTGGGGAGGSSGGNGVAGTANTGGGGGGGGVTSGNGAAGGSGIVIISYLTGALAATGGTITTVGLETIHTFTSSGSFIVTESTPLVDTNPATDVDITSVTLNGDVISGGGVIVTERGFVYGFSPNPTILNTKQIVSGTTGTYSASVTGLLPNTTYYARAYVINSYGIDYGDDITFTTMSIANNQLIKNISATNGQNYAIRLYIGGTTGTLTVKLGSTGSSQTFDAGDGYVEIQGIYSGLNGFIFEASNDFNGYIDDVMYVLVLGDSEIDWNLDTLINVLPINSIVFFKRLESDNFNRFRIVRYLDVQFKDLDAYVTVLIKKEANEKVSEDTKQFLVDNNTGDVIPFLNKRISMMNKNQAMIVGFSNNRLNENFTVCQFIIKGFDQPDKLFQGSKIINVV